MLIARRLLVISHVNTVRTHTHEQHAATTDEQNATKQNTIAPLARSLPLV
jgi:hypothetical protein